MRDSETATGDKMTGGTTTARGSTAMGGTTTAMGSRGTGGKTTATSGTTTRQNEGDGRHDDSARRP
jgi:hypothetical protein